MPSPPRAHRGPSPAPFPLLEDPLSDDHSLPAFMVSTSRGFLPRADPIATLPSPDFDALESLLARMPVRRLDGSPGLLASGRLGDAVAAELPDLTPLVAKHAHDLPLMNALYRDYSFLASAYLLEPCHERFVKGEGYGLARKVLPKQIARPIAACADICGFKPWMEYAGSYALYNYRLADPTLGMDHANLRLIRAFEHGLDPASSEAGFVLVHVEMVKNSGPLVAGVVASLDACARAASSPDPVPARAAFNRGLSQTADALRRINAVMDTMWQRSRPQSYTSFRTFIFGITSQSMFPDGVVYEGVGDGAPLSFRGESGANDSMIPLLDNLTQVPMPDTPLTEILADFREYRPSNHRAFLSHVRDRSAALDTKAYALALDVGQDGAEALLDAVRESRRLWLGILDGVREFRWRHWCFAREYILKRTPHPTATGGSPIVTWLPNQLEAVMDEMLGLYERVGGKKGGLGKATGEMMELAGRQKEMLAREVDKWCRERGVSGK